MPEQHYNAMHKTLVGALYGTLPPPAKDPATDDVIQVLNEIRRRPGGSSEIMAILDMPRNAVGDAVRLLLATNRIRRAMTRTLDPRGGAAFSVWCVNE